MAIHFTHTWALERVSQGGTSVLLCSLTRRSPVRRVAALKVQIGTTWGLEVTGGLSGIPSSGDGYEPDYESVGRGSPYGGFGGYFGTPGASMICSYVGPDILQYLDFP